MFDWKPNLVLIVASTLVSSYEDWAILSMINVNSTYKSNNVVIPYSKINPCFFVKFSASKLYWYYNGVSWHDYIACNRANTLYYYIAFP